MKKSLFLLTILGLFMTSAMAEITVEETTDAEALLNAGYSQGFVEDVFVQKNRISGKPIEPLYERSQNKFVKAYKRFCAYVDPSYENYDHIHHDIHRSPSTLDL